MDEFTLIVIAGVTALNSVAFIAGYIWGGYSERVEWNSLIKEGKLPRPVVEPNRYYVRSSTGDSYVGTRQN
jgi:hypothetical protein